MHRTADPELVVVEFSYVGRGEQGDFTLPCVFVVRVRDGHIVESRDYGDHLGLARAFGRLGPLARVLAEEGGRASDSDGSPCARPRQTYARRSST
ncbi:hypothetical protein MXD62_05430 [Frankia sp. Mgl5]|uniref:nuclear transport factor 2 family protein n=1 Tax=Frankia sp. Mgl5 TaxID=2933793 RepID=UPI00200D5C31|nr:hypothetical protein [Frankia sp. Mgl5]MCK9926615.1 hypothetical protein [Frankia sp. Mgl5]